jgi:hypothetical protein
MWPDNFFEQLVLEEDVERIGARRESGIKVRPSPFFRDEAGGRAVPLSDPAIS